MKAVSLLFSALIIMMAFALPLRAVPFTCEFGREYSGAYAPAGDNPWLTAVFSDDPEEEGAVLLTLSASGLTGAEHVKAWLFNFDGNPAGLSFSETGRTGQFNSPDIITGEDDFHAAGAGDYDIKFVFSNKKGPTKRFGALDELTVRIWGLEPITAAMFNVESAPRGGNGTHLSVAHVGGIDCPDRPGVDDEGSGWVTVPDASTLFLLGSACLIGFGASRKRSAK